MAVRVLHVDRFPLFHNGLKNLIERNLKGLVVVGFSSTVEETEVKILEYKPDILITEGTLLPALDALPYICSLRNEQYPEMKIIVLTMNADSAAFQKAVDLGADGYLYKFNSVE